MQIAGEEVEAVVDIGASAPIIGRRLVVKLGVWKRARKVKMKQGDRSSLVGKFVVNTSFEVYDSSLTLVKFAMDAEVLDIRNRDIILGLSWLTENGFSVDTQDRCLRNVCTGQVIPCAIRWIPSILTLEAEDEPLDDGDILLIIDASERYSRYAQCFSAQQAARLPEHKSWDHEIPLQDPNVKIPTGAIYKTTWEEDEALRTHLQENLPPGKVRRSRSATAAPILFVRKKDGSLRLVVDYRALNRLTIPNKYPLPLISVVLDRTSGGNWFTRLDLKNGYNLIRIAAGDEWKIAFRTKEGLFEYTVMPFGLTNAPASFQEMMDTIFKDQEGCIWYLDDILIYGGDTEAEHQAIVEKVLQQCIEHGLAVNLAKSEFHTQQTIFLGHVINGQEVQMDPAKLETMSKWPIPTKKKEVQAFLGFANYYRRFIINYSAKARPLIDLTRDVPFSWGHQQQQAFDELRARFLSAPILTQFDRNLETIMETDASNQAIAGILSQYHIIKGSKQLHPVEYHAKTLSDLQRNWPIHDKELFAIEDCFRKWRDWLVGINVNVYTDHQGLQYFNTKQKLNSRQASWYLRMSEFSYQIHYRPGAKMGKPDGLSRRSGEEKSGMEVQFFNKGQLLALEEDNNEQEEDAEDVELEGVDIDNWEKKHGLWVVPDEYKLEVLRQHHDSQVAGHWGGHRTQELISHNFTWNKWSEDVAKYVAGCIKCQKSKADRHSRQTKLVPMPMGERPFEEIAMDFVGELPESEGFNAILVVTDRFTKVQHYIPAKTTWTASDVADAYINDIWRLYGLPRHITF